MSEKIPEKTRAKLVNASIAVSLIFLYFIGKPLNALLITGFFLFLLSNILMYRKRKGKQKSDQDQTARSGE